MSVNAQTENMYMISRKNKWAKAKFRQNYTDMFTPSNIKHYTQEYLTRSICVMGRYVKRIMDKEEGKVKVLHRKPDSFTNSSKIMRIWPSSLQRTDIQLGTWLKKCAKNAQNKIQHQWVGSPQEIVPPIQPHTQLRTTTPPGDEAS